MSLFLCEQIVLDANTNNPSLIGIFTGRAVDGFPSPPERFSVFAALTDAMGTGIMELRVVDIATDEVVYQLRQSITFPDRFAVQNLNIRVRNVVFPRHGRYAVQLLIDGEHVAERRLRVYEL